MAITYGDHLIDSGANEITEEQERELDAVAECERRGIAPYEICADGGVFAWRVVDQERCNGLWPVHPMEEGMRRTQEIMTRAIERNVRSEPDKNFVDRRWLGGVSDAVDEIIKALQPSNDLALQAAALIPWRDELSEIIGHLGAAIVQSCDKDDRIIMDHIKAAHEIAKIVRRKA